MPATTASPNPHAASITRWSSPEIGCFVNMTPAHVGSNHPLHDDGNARSLIQTHLAPVCARGFRVGRGTHLENGGGDFILVANIEQRQMLTGEARSFGVFSCQWRTIERRRDLAVP